MTSDMLDRIRLDLGTRTIGKLLQKREGTAEEITLMMRIEISRIENHREALRVKATDESSQGRSLRELKSLAA